MAGAFLQRAVDASRDTALPGHGSGSSWLCEDTSKWLAQRRERSKGLSV